MAAALPQAAGAAIFRASISGKQELTWKIDGTRGSCEIHRGTGDGTVSFRFKSSKATTIFVSSSGSRLSFAGSIPSVIAKGTLAGQFTDSVATPCPGNEPEQPVTDDAGGCGPTRFGMRVDIQAKGAFLFVTGPEAPLGPVSVSLAGGGCPFPLGGSFDSGGDRSACGDGRQVWQRSWGVSTANGQGLFSSKVHMTPRQLLHAKHKVVTITGRKAVSCTVPSSYSGGIAMTGSLTYTISLKRTG